jgi:hypothetical protein
MAHCFLSKDIYLRTALAEITRFLPASKPLCIIDIESFSNLKEISGAIYNQEVTAQHKLVFIGGYGVHSRVLKPLVALSRNASIAEFSAKIRRRGAFSPQSALMYIEKYRQLRMLTRLERLTAYSIMHHADIHLAASFSNLSKGTLYAYSRQIGVKLNLASTLHVKQFLHVEYTEEESKKLLKAPL